MIVCTNIYKRQALVDYALKWDENLLSLQDSDFNIQAMVKGMHYEYADGQVDYFYRRVDSGITKKIRTEQHYHSHIYKKHLFKKEVRYSKQMTSRWIEFMKVKAESIRNDGSMNLFAV